MKWFNRNANHVIMGIINSLFLIPGFTCELSLEKRNTRIDEAVNQLNNGFENDFRNLDSDWRSVLNDINKSYAKLTNDANKYADCEK